MRSRYWMPIMSILRMR